MQLSNLILAASSILSAAAKTDVPSYYLIRHVEKTSDGSISAAGLKRAECLVTVFGKNSKYNIAYIMTQTPYAGDSQYDHETQRPYNTTLPLAESLGITIDHPCNFTDTSCAGKAALQYSGPGNVLIAWEHDHLPAVAKAIGAKDVPKYPGNHYDLIYALPSPYTSVSVSSEDCPGDGSSTTSPSSMTASTTAPASSTSKTGDATRPSGKVAIVAVGAALFFL